MKNTNEINDNLPSNFDMVYDFMIQNHIELSSFDKEKKEHTLEWIQKVFDFVLEYEKK